jgi:hypothetical protein
MTEKLPIFWENLKSKIQKSLFKNCDLLDNLELLSLFLDFSLKLCIIVDTIF